VSNAWHLGDEVCRAFCLANREKPPPITLSRDIGRQSNQAWFDLAGPPFLARPFPNEDLTTMAKSAAKSVTRSEATGSKVSAAASKVLRSKTASKAEKAVAASALTQTKSVTETTSKKVSAAASKILRSKSASKEAKSVAASALTQKVKKK
jgi:hypothetical protein